MFFFLLFQMTIGLSTLTPLALTKKQLSFFTLNFFHLYIFPFMCIAFGKKRFEKTTTFIHISYIFQLVPFTQFSKPFHPRTNSYFWHIERLARYLLLMYAITKLPFIKPAFRGFKVIPIRIAQKISDIHCFFFKQWASYIYSRSFAFFKPFVQNCVHSFVFLMVFSFKMFEIFFLKVLIFCLLTCFVFDYIGCLCWILNCSAISLQLIFLFLTTSSILIFSPKIKHLLFNFPASLFLLLIDAMLFSKWFFSNASVIFQMIKFEIRIT